MRKKLLVAKHDNKKTYTAQEIRELVELMRNQPEISAEKFSGMEYVAQVFEHFEHKSDEEIQQMIRY